MTALAAGAIRFAVEPRDVPPAKVARRLHLTLAEFEAVRERLFARKFPRPDPDTGNYDLKAVDAWMDERSRLTPAGDQGDAVASARERIRAMRDGRREA